MKKDQNLRLAHFESCSGFSDCKHSSVYRVFWPSDQSPTAAYCFLKIPDYLIRTHDIQNCVYNMKSLNNILNALPSNSVHIEGLVFFILSKA